MDSKKTSPFVPAGQEPLTKNPPLAPSQELAYRHKCIQLKRRLQEIEASNDKTRRNILAERHRIQKMRLLRSILMNQLKDTMDIPGRKWQQEELERLGIVSQEDDRPIRRQDGVLEDDSSEDSDEDAPEPADRPIRNRRQNNNYRDSVMSTAQNAVNPSQYQPSTLPSLAPAGAAPAMPNTSSYLPGASQGRESLLSSSFQTPQPIAGSPTAAYATVASAGQPQQFIQDPRYSTASSPLHASKPLPVIDQTSKRARAPLGYDRDRDIEPSSRRSTLTSRDQDMAKSNPPPSAPPVHPPPPYDQFCAHMRPQLEADNYPRELIQGRIDEEWKKLSGENRALWDERYNEQMNEYERDMDAWKAAQRRSGGVGRL